MFLTATRANKFAVKLKDFLDDLREDPEYAKERICEKLTEVKEQATDFVLKTKEQVESGEITLTVSFAQAKNVLDRRQKHQKNDSIISRSKWQEKAETL